MVNKRHLTVEQATICTSYVSDVVTQDNPLNCSNLRKLCHEVHSLVRGRENSVFNLNTIQLFFLTKRGLKHHPLFVIVKIISHSMQEREINKQKEKPFLSEQGYGPRYFKKLLGENKAL